MTIFQSLILGIVQGVTEFLPVSSSGHLVLVQYLFGLQEVELSFDILLHLATLLAIIIFFWKQLWQLKFKDLFLIGLGTIPAVVVGLLFKDQIEGLFNAPKLVAVTLLVTGLINFGIDRLLDSKKATKPVDYRSALLAGFFQAIAITPGISRSGSTVFGGMLGNLSREEAFRFSFFLAIPAILGASVLQLTDLPTGGLNNLISLPYLVGVLGAFVAGILSLSLFKFMIEKAKFEWFGYYCFIVGFGALILL